MPNKKKKRIYLDYGILIPYLILVITGIIMVYSASSYSLLLDKLNPASDAIKQIIYAVIGLVLIGFIYKMKTTVLRHKRFIMLAIGVISLLLVLTRFTASAVNGTAGWLNIGGFTIQPSEFLKITVVWFLAYSLSIRQNKIALNAKEAALRPLLIVAGLIFLVLIQPDTGSAVMIFLLAAMMFFASGVDYTWSLKIGGTAVLSAFAVIELVLLSGGSIFPQRFMYIYNRFRVFRNPFVDALGSGHQMTNGYYAMHNGGLFGVGLGNSIEKKGFLSEASTDFMFAIVMEELGLLLSLVLLGILLFLILRIALVGIRSTNPFNSMVCIGVSAMILIQVFVNLGGVSGIIPLTGVTFPFLSKGGSSLLALSIGIGFVLNISADEKRRAQARELRILPV